MNIKNTQNDEEQDDDLYDTNLYDTDDIEKFFEDIKQNDASDFLIDIINLENNSEDMVKKYNKYIEIWWDSEQFNWESACELLPEYCSEYFDIWWNSEKYNWEQYELLIKYCTDFITETEILNLKTLHML